MWACRLGRKWVVQLKKDTHTHPAPCYSEPPPYPRAVPFFKFEKPWEQGRLIITVCFPLTP